MNDASSIVNTLWSCCNVRRDDDRGAMAQIEEILVDLAEVAV
jgi:hypothetical protein